MSDQIEPTPLFDSSFFNCSQPTEFFWYAFFYIGVCRLFHSFRCSSWNEKWISHLEKNRHDAAQSDGAFELWWHCAPIESARSADRSMRQLAAVRGAGDSLCTAHDVIRSNPHMFSNVTNEKRLNAAKLHLYEYIVHRIAELNCRRRIHFFRFSYVLVSSFFPFASFMLVYRWYLVKT